MKAFFKLIQTLDYIRLVVGILILVNGYPLIFFFRETLKLAPGSTAFTAAVLAGGLVMMVPFTVLRRLYRPNTTMLWMGVSFIVVSILYMFLFNGVPGYEDYDRDMIYFTYILVFMFLLINIPNDIVKVFIPVVVLFTLVSNLGLIYSLITNPTWAIGQRATITLGDNDDGSGNPHVFARNAFMGLVACAIWLLQSRTNILFRLLSLVALVINLAVLVLTQTRSAIVALILAGGLFFFFNVRPAQLITAVKSLFKPVSLLVIAFGIAAIAYFIDRYYDVYGILYGYVMGFAEKNLENVYALLGLKTQAGYRATLDDSAANRSVSALFFRNVLVGHLHMLILGYGYKFLYLDVPIIEAFIDLGIPGAVLFGGTIFLSLYHSLGVMRRNPNPLSVFLAYFFLLTFVLSFTGGRPFEISFWFPLALMIRFMGVDHLFPAHLSEQPVRVVERQPEVLQPA